MIVIKAYYYSIIIIGNDNNQLHANVEFLHKSRYKRFLATELIMLQVLKMHGHTKRFITLRDNFGKPVSGV